MFGQLLQKVSPFAVLTLFPFALLAASCHLPLRAGLSRRPDFNGRILKRSRLQSHFTATLQQKLHHIRVHQTLDTLSIHMSDEVPSPQPSLVSRTAVFNAPDHVVHRVDISVTHVDPNGTERKAILPPRAVDDHRRTKNACAEREVSVWGRVPR